MIARQRRHWDDLAFLDPLWAILSDPGRRFGGWDAGEFFATGEREISEILSRQRPQHTEAVLDFGCGVGRLTRALARRFDRCVGIDISPRMIELARTLNADVERCVFMVNDADSLEMFDSEEFDFVYSNIVLQHLPTRRSIAKVIAEFMRVVRASGLVVFQLPARIAPLHRLQPRAKLYRVLRRFGVPPEFLYRRIRLHPITMRALPEAVVKNVLVEAGARVVTTSPGNGRLIYYAIK